MDAYAITNPRRALKKREEEAGTGSDGNGGTAAPARKAAPPEMADGGLRWSKGGKPQTLTPEEQAKRIEQFRALQRKQRAQVI